VSGKRLILRVAIAASLAAVIGVAAMPQVPWCAVLLKCAAPTVKERVHFGPRWGRIVHRPGHVIRGDGLATAKSAQP
jgi:hypothetical protein